MIFTEEWLRQYVNPALGTDELADALTMAGLEVEEVRTIAPAFSGVVVGEVLSCRDHENSDHLHVCEVNAGTGETLQIVCGAPNVRAGIKVACATIGAVLPGDFRIKKSKLRGVVSMGMLCSTRELGINEDHNGIWILPDDAPVGVDIRQYARLDDAKIELKLTPNRGDALSVVGVARDVHAITGAPLTLPAMDPVAATCSCTLPVDVQAPDLCGRFTSRILRGLNAAAPTPDWMKARLERCGMRSISALVDISNYVMLELGRPTHFYDLKKIPADRLTVRWAREGESVQLLNGETVALDPWYGVICAGDEPECLAGIMGGESSSISTETTDLFIESAFWFPKAIQGRCRKLNFSTDAAYRYERGVDFASTAEHLEYITRLVLDICGTPETTVGPVADVQTALPTRAPVKMRVDRCRKVVGVEIPVESMETSFKRLGFDFTYDDGVFTVVPPSFRFDIEIEEDLIEEVARLYGLEKLPDRPPLARSAMKPSREERRDQHALRREMAEQGYQELINFSFVPEDWERVFAGNDSPIRLLNPIASQLSVMRTQLIGGLVDILKYNLNRRAERVRGGADGYALGDWLGDAEHAADGDGDDVAEDAGNDDHGDGQRHIAAELLRDAHADGGRDGLRQERDVLLMRKVEGEAQCQHAAQRGEHAREDTGENGPPAAAQQREFLIERDGEAHGRRREQVAEVLRPGVIHLVIDVRGDEHKDRDDDGEEQGIEERQTEAPLQHHAEPVGKQAERNAEKDGVFKKFHAHTSLPRRRKNCVTRPETTMTSTVVITAMAR